jgi:hypothetical protein
MRDDVSGRAAYLAGWTKRLRRAGGKRGKSDIIRVTLYGGGYPPPNANIFPRFHLVCSACPLPTPPLFSIFDPRCNAGIFTVSVQTSCGWDYTLEYKHSLSDLNWTANLPIVHGDGSVKILAEPIGRGTTKVF